MKNLNVFIIVIVILVLVIAGYFYFLNPKIDLNKILPISSLNKTSNYFGIISQADIQQYCDHELTYNSTPGKYNFSVGNLTFNIHCPDNSDSPDSYSANWGGWFEVYQGDKKVFSTETGKEVGKQNELGGSPISILSFKYGENTYAVINTYSGGAHCCFANNIFRLNKDNTLKIFDKTIDNTEISSDGLIFKDNNLYISYFDLRFDYFHVSHAGSYLFSGYYRLDGDNFIEASSDFKDEFIKKAEDCGKQLDDLISAATVKKETVSSEEWFGQVVCRVVNYKLAGQENLVWSKFDDYFNNQWLDKKDLDGKTMTSAGVKAEISQNLTNL